MRRRILLQTPFLAAMAQPKPAGFKLSVRVEPLFPKLNLETQMERVREAGYQGFEFGDWRAGDAAGVTRLKNRLGLECACLVGNRGVNPPGMGLCDPAERAGFLAEMRASVDAAQRFESSRLVVLSGFRVPRMARPRQHASIVEGLKRAHDVVAPHGVTMIVEVINTLAPIEPLRPEGDNHANYYLDRTSEAFDIVREVGSPFVKVLFDLYHVQIMEGNLIETIRKNIGAIGHFHVGDVPGRHQPGTGEIHYPNVFRAIRATGFRDFVAMEYVPSKDAMETLKETRAMAFGD
ncbi:MAG TPA: TIM barrel protein [Bryobacteraceae bacterium]|jgi:hydroxypyruvate isomerase|nr:TIM barrel protein [Bryobacteraceae bacterium]